MSIINLPEEIVKELGFSADDKFEVYEKDGMIHLIPVVIYPDKYVKDLYSEIATLKEETKSGKHPLFDNVKKMFNILER